MKLLAPLVLFLFLSTPADAACKHATKHRAACPNLWEQFQKGFELQAGFRWQTETECPTLYSHPPTIEVKDPFFLGAGVRLPLAKDSGVFGNFDRDFTEASRWQTRVGLYFKPF